MPYEFTPDGFNAFSADILAAEGDQATLTSVLADMQGTFVESVASKQAADTDIQKIREENNRLLEKNAQLFLRVGQQINAENGFGGSPQPKPEEKPLSTAEYMNNYFLKLKGGK